MFDKGLRDPNDQAETPDLSDGSACDKHSARELSRVTNRMASRSGWKAKPKRVKASYTKAMRL